MRMQCGSALIWVLGVLSISLLVLFTVAGWLVAVHAADHRDRARADARLLAENAVQLALAELNHDQNYAGAATTEAQIAVTTPPAAAPGSSPWYTLDSTDARDWRTIATAVELGSVRISAGGTARAIYGRLSQQACSPPIRWNSTMSPLTATIPAGATTAPAGISRMETSAHSASSGWAATCTSTAALTPARAAC